MKQRTVIKQNKIKTIIIIVIQENVLLSFFSYQTQRKETKKKTKQCILRDVKKNYSYKICFLDMTHISYAAMEKWDKKRKDLLYNIIIYIIKREMTKIMQNFL